MSWQDRAQVVHDACKGKGTNAQGFVRIDCPFCLERYGKEDRHCSFGYNPSSGRYKCFRCGQGGNTQAVSLGTNYKQETEEEKEVIEIDRSSFFSLTNKSLLDSPVLKQARAYLNARGVNKLHWRRSNMHAAISGRYVDRVIIPHEDARGVWWGFTARTYAKSVASLFGDSFEIVKVLYPPGMSRDRLYNDQALQVETSTPVMVVEGCLDAAWYMPDCVASLGKPTAAHFDQLKKAQRPIVFCLDGDAWETGRALALRLRLRGLWADYVKLPAKEDPNSVSPEWLMRQVEKTQEKYYA